MDEKITEEVQKEQEMREDAKDLHDLEEAIQNNAADPGIPYEEFRKTLKFDA